MDTLIKISKFPIFKFEMLQEIVGNPKTAYSVLNRYQKKGVIRKIRNNLYSTIDLSTGLIRANKYQIASAIRDDAYLSLHSALEWHGLANQVYNTIYISTKNRFNAFTFDGITYKYVTPKINDGILYNVRSLNVNVTNIERTIIDSIYFINKVSGYEELHNAMEQLIELDESEVLNILSAYNIQSLYQKVGYFFEKYQTNLNFSEYFYTFCKSKIKHGVVYFETQSQESKYNDNWQIMEPSNTYLTELDDD